MIGLAFSHLGAADNIGYIIPCEEIELFLKDVADGRYDGKPAMFDELQTFENPALRKFLNSTSRSRELSSAQPDGPGSDYPLKQWDVISKIGDTPVDNQGMVRLADNLHVRFQYLVQKVARGMKAPLTVVRGGKEMQIEVPLQPAGPWFSRVWKAPIPPILCTGRWCFPAPPQTSSAD